MVEQNVWKDGVWYDYDAPIFIFLINGQDVVEKPSTYFDYPNANVFLRGTLKSGQFGPTSPEIAKMTGASTYNMEWEWTLLNLKMHGVVTDDGSRMYKCSYIPGKVDVVQLLNDDQIAALKESREPFESPSLPLSYKTPLQDLGGKIIWFTGPGGSGKSTSAQLMARNHGYVFYEVDCILNAVNPYIDMHHKSPTLAQFNQTPLKVDKQDVFEAIQSWAVNVNYMFTGQIDKIQDHIESTLRVAAEHLVDQKKRLGCSFAVAGQQCSSRKHRDIVRKVVGSSMVFIVLKLTSDCRLKRLYSRHSNSKEQAEILDKVAALYEKGADDETDTHTIEIDFEMSPDDVINEVLRCLNNQ